MLREQGEECALLEVIQEGSSLYVKGEIIGPRIELGELLVRERLDQVLA